MALTANVHGHLALNITYQINLDDNNRIVSAEIDKDNEIKFFWSDVMKEFISTCFGTYEVNIYDYTITFSDSRDYMRYCLEIAQNNSIMAS